MIMAGTRQSIFNGDKFPSQRYGTFEILDYVSSSEIKIAFEDGTELITNSSNVRTGKVRNPNYRSIHGIGFVGQGIYPTSINRQNTKEYNAWRNMFDRCYSEKELLKSPRRIGSQVIEEWHSFQNFARWCNEQPSWGLKDWALDKDLLVKDNVNYGPDVCCFLPIRLNTILHIADGIPCVKQLATCWAVQIRELDGSYGYSGSYASEAEAIIAYKNKREKIVQTLAEQVKESLQPKVYSALISWEA